MNNIGKLSIHFKARPERIRDGRFPIYMGVTLHGQKTYIALKAVEISEKEWDKSRGRGRAETKAGKELNDHLDDLRVLVKQHYKSLQTGGEAFCLETLKALVLGISLEPGEKMFSDLVAYHNEQAASLLAKGTFTHYFVTQRYLLKFFKKKFKTDDIPLRQLDYKFICDFQVFLINHKPTGFHPPMQNNGVIKHLVRLKKMVNLAINLDWIDKNPFRGFKMKLQKVEKEFLNEWELKQLENKKLRIERLAIVRDMFVFSCYTGLAFVDMQNLKPANIVIGLDGHPWIRTFRQKTLVPVNTPLLPNAIEIIERYRTNIRAQIEGRLFPIFSNQKMNAYLKEIAVLCGISKNMTYHVARHTFATTVTLSNGVPIETVSKILGHTKIATTQIYARVLEQKISQDMLDLREKLSK